MTILDHNNDEGISLSAPVIMELIEAVHEKGAPFRFQAKGYSMTPAIRNGDFITISPLSVRTLGLGAVFAFRHPERPQLLVHRVLRKRKNSFYFQGDNVAAADGWISVENIVGLITRVERGGKNIFWPDPIHAWGRFYFLLYTLWPPVRRIMAKGYRFFKNNRRLPG